MGCSSGFKVTLIILNTFSLLIGIAFIAVGAVYLSQAFQPIVGEVNSNFAVPQIVLTVVGCLIFITALTGCVGAVRESKCLLYTYASLLTLFFILQLSIAIYAFTTYKPDSLRNALDQLFVKTDEVSKGRFGDLEVGLSCCGVDGPADYKVATCPIPLSCYEGEDAQKTLFQEGCAKALEDWIKELGNLLGGLAIGLGVVEVIGVVLTVLIARRLDDLY